MVRLSKRICEVQNSPIRKLTPLADAAKARGINIYHLNIGQPDIETPEEAFDALRKIDRKVLEYSPSQGFRSLREKLSRYYAGFGMNYNPDQIIVTSGASEAVSFMFMACLNPGDEIITTEPTYANYVAFAIAAGINVRTVVSRIEDNFALPTVEDFENAITPATKAILICNPNNPTGALYSPEEMRGIGELVRRHDMYLFSDEVYREFIYGGEFLSAGQLEGIDDNVVLIDSFSKRYSECGIRVGSIVTKNDELSAAILKLAQSRLSPPLLGQIVAEASCDVRKEYMDNVIKEYDLRRKALMEGLRQIPGVVTSEPLGAFYTMVKLPVDDADKFCAWCLSDFEYEGETVMMAPASGFYVTPGLGLSEVRIAYVLEVEKLRRAIKILAAAIKKYNEIFG